ncbi:MAG TPA: hypothetical protein PKX31_14245 [Chitinophagaceae bacterium]|nr:hypothetical protein [Chitinophagaceae bacterium]
MESSKDLKDLAEIMLREDQSLKHRKSGKLPKEQWYTEVVKDLFSGDINSFVKAREIYKVVITNNSPIAFIYRRPDLSKIKIAYRKAGVVIIQLIKQLLNQESDPKDSDIDALMIYARATAEEYGKNNHPEDSAALHAIIVAINDWNVIKNIVEVSKKTYNEKTIDNFFQSEMNQKIGDLAEQAFFKNNDIKGLRIKNVIYHPGFYHKWISNLAWLIANLKSRKKFLVISDIAEDSNKFRDSNPNEHSAFSREICAAIKAGYELKREGSEIFLTPSETFDPNKCTTNGFDGDGISPSKEEVDNIYSKIQKKLLSTTGDFTFTYVEEEKKDDTNKNAEIASPKVLSTDPADSLNSGGLLFSITSLGIAAVNADADREVEPIDKPVSPRSAVKKGV